MSPVASDASSDTERRGSNPTYDALVRRRNLFGALAVFFLIVMVATWLLDMATTVHEDRSFPVGASSRLVIRDAVSGGLRGGLEVHAGTGDRIRVEGTIHGTWRVRYMLEQRGEDIVIDAHPRAFLGWLGLLGPARFVVTAPANSRLDVETLNAAIDVQGIAGGGVVRSTNGAISLAGAGGALTAITTNGAVMARGFDGTAKLETTNGAIDVGESRGSFDLTTVNGAVMLDADLRSGEHHRAATTNGSVTVRLHGEPSLRVDARTVNGAVEAHRPIAASQQEGHALVGTIGSGAGELLLRSVNGRIEIE